MSYTNGLDKPSDYFSTKLYTGDGTSSNAITGVGFQPDWIWIKNRTLAGSWHYLFDSIRGANKTLYSNLTAAETTDNNNLQSFDSDGFTVGSNADVNGNTNSIVSWNWLASNTTASNTDGSITSTVSANTTSGFSIVSYTGTGSNATVGHGLGSAPSMIIVKNRSAVKDWVIYHKSLGNTKFLEFTTSGEQTASNRWNSTTPTSSVFSLGSDNGANGSGNSQIAYCFAEKQGFSKFGSLISNNSDNGTFAYTGFSPAWVMLKGDVTDTWSDWYIFDNKRKTSNLNDVYLQANDSVAETGAGANYAQIDMLSNGFKIRRDSNWGYGGSGTKLIYMAFAESPFVTSTGIPTTAR